MVGWAYKSVNSPLMITDTADEHVFLVFSGINPNNLMDTPSHSMDTPSSILNGC